MIRYYLILWTFILLSSSLFAQVDTCNFKFKEHKIVSENLNEIRTFWVSLPLNYSDSKEYNVMYVLDAEWRFDLIRNIEFDYSANNLIDKHIVVGIPHIDVETKRGYDLSFSESRIEYDGEKVDSTWYNSSNSGGGMRFFKFLTEELIPAVDSSYSTNDNNTLIGHSMGGYFAGYILSMNHPFTTLHLYDPSIWYSDGEVTELIKNKGIGKDSVSVFVSYQPEPVFHKEKIEELIFELHKFDDITVHSKKFTNRTHNSLYLPSFLEGIELQVNERLHD